MVKCIHVAVDFEYTAILSSNAAPLALLSAGAWTDFSGGGEWGTCCEGKGCNGENDKCRLHSYDGKIVG